MWAAVTKHQSLSGSWAAEANCSSRSWKCEVRLPTGLGSDKKYLQGCGWLSFHCIIIWRKEVKEAAESFCFVSPFIKASLSSCWETEILNNILWTEKELWDWKTKCTTPRSTIMKFVVGRLRTGRKDRAGRLKIQKHWQLYCAAPKWVLEDSKGTKLKVVFGYKVRNMSVPTGTEIFSFPHRCLMTINICIRKRHSCRFHIRQRQGWK